MSPHPAPLKKKKKKKKKDCSGPCCLRSGDLPSPLMANFSQPCSNRCLNVNLQKFLESRKKLFSTPTLINFFSSQVTERKYYIIHVPVTVTIGR